MKTLSLLRHATAVKDPRFTDYDRPLEPSGEREIARLGVALRDLGIHFDQVVASAAVRTATTAALLLKAMGHGAERLKMDRALYTSSVPALLKLVGQVSDQVGHLLLVGHNPEFSELANRFSPDIGELDPCTCVSFDFDAESWLGLALETPVRVSIRRPPH